MDIYKTALFPYVSGDALVGKPVVMTIKAVVIEKMTGLKTGKEEEKVLVYFNETKKPLILNKTNAKKLAKNFGRDTDGWAGRAIELFSEEIKAFGELHNAVRLRIAKIDTTTQRIKSEKLNGQEHKDRLAKNKEDLRGRADDTPIGEDGTNGDWLFFIARIIQEIPFFTNEAQVKAALDLLELTYSPETEQLCYAELSESASKQADALAA